MKFLCLHGHGTSSQIFNTQTAAIFYELGDGHTFSFVEGTIPVPLAPEFHDTLAQGPEERTNETYFAYFDDTQDSGTTGAVALAQLDAYIAAEGPFDLLLGFSTGAALAATWLASRRRGAGYGGIRCAVLFSTIGVYDAGSLARGEVCLIGRPGDGHEEGGPDPLVDIPTAHVWGREDRVAAEAAGVAALCNSSTREIYVHNSGHEIPGVKDREAVKAVVKIIRRVIATASC